MLDRRSRATKEDLNSNNLLSNGYMEIETRSTNTSEISFYKETPGGTSLNTIRTISNKNNIKTSFIGAIGNDNEGRILLEKLKTDSVSYFLEVLDEPTALCSVLINRSERSLVTNLGAANKLSTDFIRKTFPSVCEAKFLYVSGFFASAMPDNAKWVLEHFNHSKIIFNLSYNQILDKINIDLLNEIVAKSHVLIGNSEEFESLSRLLWNEINENRMYKFSMDKIIVITDGKKSTICYSSGRKSLHKVEYIGSNIDTCGAGDYFAAGFIAGLYDNKSLEESIEQGHEWARENILINTADLNQLYE